MHPLQFADATTPIELAYTPNYSLPLVVLSIAIAIFAAYASVSHVDLMRITHSVAARMRWHCMGALAMGGGIWAMHFVGMAAVQLPVAVNYDVGLTLASVLPAIGAGFIALEVMREQQPKTAAILIGGTLMGLGIGIMHYLGMGGMIVNAKMLYQPGMFALSVVVAVVASMVALSIPRWLTDIQSERDTRNSTQFVKVFRASLIGLAISSLHYVAMEATLFLPAEQSVALPPASPLGESLITAIAVVTSMAILILSIVAVVSRERIIESETIAEASLSEKEQLEDRFSKLVPRLPGMVYQFKLDPEGNMSFPYASEAIRSIYGVEPEDVKDNVQVLFKTIHPDDLDGVLASIRASAKKLDVWLHEYRVVLNQQERWLQGNALPEQLDDGSLLWSGFITDVTDRKQADAKIYELAYYDNLTGLPNRRLFEDRIGLALAASRRHRQYGALLYIDLDDFKSLNDTLGHSFGDELLKALASMLGGACRKTDTVARLGGDEFVIVLGELGSEKTQAAERVTQFSSKILELLEEPINLNGFYYRCQASIGVSLFIGSELSREELLKQADTAMYEAKAAGRSMIRLHDPEVHSVLSQRFRLEIELRQAFEREELFLVYQKQTGRTGQCEAVEALLRWHHTERGLVSPGEFIPIAEGNGLIIPLGQWVLEKACQQLAAWQAQDHTRHLTVSVNVSSKQFHQLNFVERVLETLRETGAHPEGLCLEITESLVIADLDDALSKMKAFREYGIQLSMDDFGTGYSSMAYLSKLPFNEVKIDKSFVQQMGRNDSGNDRIILETIISMAHHLGLSVVAEGVETEQQFQFLDQLQCDRFQGYFLGRPMDVEHLDLS